jgi:putative DNA primase/helicase
MTLEALSFENVDLEKQAASGEDQEIKRLAKLKPIEYEKERTEAAKRLGVRTPILDKLVAAEWPQNEAAPGQGRKLELPEPKLWPEPVSGVALLDAIETLLARFIICNAPDRAAVALWITLTWFEEAAQVAPILNVQSPEKRCGKSTLLSLIVKLAKRPLPSSSISAAGIFRIVERYRPTLVIDEADAFLNDNEEARGIINSGHARDAAFVIRCEGDPPEPVMFSTWGFKAIAGIGRRAVTIEDRSITIKLRRKAPGEKVERLRYAPRTIFDEAAAKLARFAQDNMQAFAKVRPSLPDSLNDRAQDNWEGLLAIAEIAGGAWPQKAKEGALAFNGADDDQSPSALLLADIREVLLSESGKNELPSKTLVDALVAMADRPWSECNHGKPITQNWLARRLKDFGIRPAMTGPETKRVSGYKRGDFGDAFTRYLPNGAFKPHILTSINDFNHLDENQSSHRKSGCKVEKADNPLISNEMCGCEVENPVSGANAQAATFEGSKVRVRL